MPIILDWRPFEPRRILPNRCVYLRWIVLRLGESMLCFVLYEDVFRKDDSFDPLHLATQPQHKMRCGYQKANQIHVLRYNFHPIIKNMDSVQSNKGSLFILWLHIHVHSICWIWYSHVSCYSLYVIRQMAKFRSWYNSMPAMQFSNLHSLPSQSKQSLLWWLDPTIL